MADKRKPLKTPAVKATKRRSGVKDGEQIAPVKKHNRSLDLQDWLAEIGSHAEDGSRFRQSQRSMSHSQSPNGRE